MDVFYENGWTQITYKILKTITERKVKLTALGCTGTIVPLRGSIADVSARGLGIRMKISTKGRYALRMMIDIALNDNGDPVRIKDISKRQGISDKYLEQIISVLNKAGYVKSVRGPQGGYRLTKAPSEYTVGSILRLIEGDLAPVSCLELDATECERKQECVTLILWKKLNEAINNVVDNITIENLIEWQQEQADNYVI